MEGRTDGPPRPAVAKRSAARQDRVDMAPPKRLVRRRRRAWSATAATVSAALLATACEATLVRITLENYDQMQFFATIHVGKQPFRVIFDTGSSDVWVPGEQCRACAGHHRYHANASRPPRAVDDEGFEVVTVGEDDDHEPFSLQYGSGTVSGTAIRETLRLGGSLELPNARIGSVHEQGREIQRFQTEGIVGLAMAPLARVSNPSILQLLQESSEYTLPVVFSLYVSPFPTASPPSQLIFGGVDPALAGPDAGWHRFPVVDDPYSAAYGFWSLYLDEMTIHPVDHREAPYAVIGGSQHSDLSVSDSPTPVAIVDSGTSLVLLPPAAYAAVIKAMQRRLGSRMRNHSQKRGGYSCHNCDHSEFPALAFSFQKDPNSRGAHSVQRFVLQGSDYVRCENRVCSPQLDESSSDMVILGDIFLRAYYTVFDYERKQLGFACPSGDCSGGVKPPLELDAGTAQLTDLVAVYVRSSVVVAAAVASLWSVSQLHAWLTVLLTARAATRRSTGQKRPTSRLAEKPKTHCDAVQVTVVQLPIVKTTARGSDRVGLPALAG
jgi:cathepsin E